MILSNRKRSYRAYLGIIVIIITSLSLSGIGKMWYYFNSGADRSRALNLPPNIPDAHTPLLEWLPDDPNTGRAMEAFTRQQLMSDYTRGLYQWQLSYLTGKPVGLKEYFTPSTYPKVLYTIKTLDLKNLTLHQTDLEHHIKLHFYSADGQIVSFTDKRVLHKQRLYKKNNKLFSGESMADFDVVMLLDDGYWRIKHFVKKNPSTIDSLKKDTLIDQRHFVSIKHNHFILEEKRFQPKGVNYYPQKTPWSFFWTKYDSTIIKKDCQRIHQLGFNSIRIFINFHDFEKGLVPELRLLQLGNLLNNAQQNQLKVIVTLFDFMGDYRLLNFASSDRQLETILHRFQGHPAILAWDLKNEPDLDFKHHPIEDVKEWLTWILPRAKKYDPNHLITLGWAYPENAALFKDKVDFISFHSYRSLEELELGVDLLKKQIGQKPLVLEEFGMSTYRGLWAPFGGNEEKQATYFESVKRILQRKGNIPYLAWTLYDFSDVPSDIAGKYPWQRIPQKSFGIIKTDGSLKKGASVLK